MDKTIWECALNVGYHEVLAVIQLLAILSSFRHVSGTEMSSHVSGPTEKQRRTSARVSRTEKESSRPHPTNDPCWAVRSD